MVRKYRYEIRSFFEDVIFKQPHVKIILLIIILAHIGCSCIEYVNKNGFGNCNKSYEKNSRFSCYVNEPSTCEDVRNSSTDPGLRFSFEACEIIEK